MTTPREDAIACRRHDWSAGHDYRGFQWVEATVCRRCGAVKAPRRTTPREDAIAALDRLWRAYIGVHSAYDGECEHGFGPPATSCPNPGCPDRELAEAWASLRAAVRAEAETPDLAPADPTADLRAALLREWVEAWEVAPDGTLPVRPGLVMESRAALAAAPETPDHVIDSPECHHLPGHHHVTAPETPKERQTTPKVGGHWVDLASPEAAETLARAYWTKFAENTNRQGILSMPAWDDLPPESRKAGAADAAAILAAMREAGR